MRFNYCSECGAELDDSGVPISHLPSGELEPMPLPPLAKAGETAKRVKHQFKDGKCERCGVPWSSQNSGHSVNAEDCQPTHNWNVEQILVYVWHCLGDEMDGVEYPYTKFTESEMGKRLRLELTALAGRAAAVPELSAGEVASAIFRVGGNAAKLAQELNALLKSASTRIGE